MPKLGEFLSASFLTVNTNLTFKNEEQSIVLHFHKFGNSFLTLLSKVLYLLQFLCNNQIAYLIQSQLA